MRRKIRTIKPVMVLGLISGLVLLMSTMTVAQMRLGDLDTNIAPDVSSRELRVVVVEDFENESEWTVETTPKAFEGDEEKKNPVPTLEYKFVPGGPADMEVEDDSSPNGLGKEKEQVFGVNFMFRYPGHNSVHIIAPREEVDGVMESTIQVPGRAHAISIWVHGRGNPYNLEVWVKDHKGSTHILKMSSVNFVGWRPMTVNVPRFIPQDTDSYPQTRTLRIERFVLRVDPAAGVENTFFFFDQLKVLTETFEVNFDGKGLEANFESYEGGAQ